VNRPGRPRGQQSPAIASATAQQLVPRHRPAPTSCTAAGRPPGAEGPADSSQARPATLHTIVKASVAAVGFVHPAPSSVSRGTDRRRQDRHGSGARARSHPDAVAPNSARAAASGLRWPSRTATPGSPAAPSRRCSTSRLEPVRPLLDPLGVHGPGFRPLDSQVHLPRNSARVRHAGVSLTVQPTAFQRGHPPARPPSACFPAPTCSTSDGPAPRPPACRPPSASPAADRSVLSTTRLCRRPKPAIGAEPCPACRTNGNAPAQDTEPWLGRNPTSPHRAAGMRTEPPGVGAERGGARCPAATAAPEPELEPPVIRLGSQRVARRTGVRDVAGGSVGEPRGCASCRRSRPLPGAARRRRPASAVGTC